MIKSVLIMLFFCFYASEDLFAQGQKINHLQKLTTFKVKRFKYSSAFNTTHFINFTITKDSTHFEFYSNDYKKITQNKIAVATIKSEWESLVATFDFWNFEHVQPRKPFVSHIGVRDYKQTFSAETSYGSKEIINTPIIDHDFTFIRPFTQNLIQLVEKYRIKYPMDLIKTF